MVLRELGGDSVLCIGQPAHAWLSGQLARAWGNGLFPAPWPREEVVLAAAQHDVGMARWDADPGLNPDTGWPRSFMEMPLEVHLEQWSWAPWLALAQSRWAGLLVSMHGSMLFERRAGQPGVAEYLDTQRALQGTLIASLDVTEAQAERNQRLIAAWDWFSLALCMDRLPETIEVEPGLAIAPSGDEISVAPWPFADDVVEVTVEGRRLDRRCEDQDSLRAALAAAPWETLRWTLRPG